MNPLASRHFMQRFTGVFCAAGILLGLLCSPAAMSAAVSPKEFTAALNHLGSHDFNQGGDAFGRIAGMVRTSANHPDESRWLAGELGALLRKNTNTFLSDFICRQLAIIGTEAEVGALSPLLTDPGTSDMARYALERIGGYQARNALRLALPKTTGRTTIGLVNSLALLHDLQAVRALAELGAGPDGAAASAAVAALGKMGGPAAERALRTLSIKAQGNFLTEVQDAYLECADLLAAAKKKSQALAIYKKLFWHASSPDIRSLALRGLVTASGPEGITVVLNILKNNDLSMQPAALSLAGQIPGRKATLELAQALPGLPSNLQVKLLGILAYRQDPAALPQIVKTAQSGETPARIAALDALGELGNASAVAFLAQAASENNASISESARNSLNALKGQAVDGEILRLLNGTNRMVQLELLRTVTQRKLFAATPALIQLARQNDPALRTLCFKALSRVAETNALPALVDLLIHAAPGEGLLAASDAVESVAARAGTESDPTRFLRAAYPGLKDVVTQNLILKILGEIGDAASLPLVQEALNSPESGVSMTALKALAAWPTAAPLPVLQQRLNSPMEPGLQLAVLSGFIRQIGLDEGRTADQKVMLYRQAFEHCARPEEKKAVLAGLAGVKTLEALALAAPCLMNEALKTEAALAVALIACPQTASDSGLRGPEAIAALQKAASLTGLAEQRRRIDEYLSTMPEDETGFTSLFNGKDLTGWRGSDFVVTNGLLLCHGHHGGYLACTKSEFTNFVMRFEVKLSPAANNGLNFRTDGSVWNEIQILDDSHPVFTNLHPYQMHGSIYGVVPSKRGSLKPAGEWNYEEVTADSTHIRVRLNGNVIVDVDLNGLDLEKCLDGTAHPGLRRASGGIGWLGHLNGYEKEGPIWFRNIRLKELP